jgi:hypothetical protein
MIMNNKRCKNRLFLPLVFVVSILAVSGLATAESPTTTGKAGCVTWKTEARYIGLGFKHFVYYTSACKEAMVCSVTTDANPNPTVTTVPPGGKATAITHSGSPASEFTANVSCKKK